MCWSLAAAARSGYRGSRRLVTLALSDHLFTRPFAAGGGPAETRSWVSRVTSDLRADLTCDMTSDLRADMTCDMTSDLRADLTCDVISDQTSAFTVVLLAYLVTGLTYDITSSMTSNPTLTLTPNLTRSLPLTTHLTSLPYRLKFFT